MLVVLVWVLVLVRVLVLAPVWVWPQVLWRAAVWQLVAARRSCCRHCQPLRWWVAPGWTELLLARQLLTPCLPPWRQV